MGKKDYQSPEKKITVFKIERIFPRHNVPLSIRALILGRMDRRVTKSTGPPSKSSKKNLRCMFYL
jgi:hypothetical protein